ncbi:MAG: hypothetical protein IPI66_03585 [Chitinophagaceae bacterium]|nr:hypothetical protein [Chitinophagaceae bacterium]MBL0055435.1 hypothetical protein [Chitinophagaceae bacterium]
MKNNLVEGEDYYYNEEGYLVLTARYHLERGHCCGNGCLHCPYQYNQVPEPRRSELLSSANRPVNNISDN